MITGWPSLPQRATARLNRPLVCRSFTRRLFRGLWLWARQMLLITGHAFSRTGAQLDVVAPGVSILSTTPLSGALHYSLGHEYDVLGGTSMAAGFATGAASLMAGLPQYDSPDALYEGLRNTAKDLGAVGKDDLNRVWTDPA